METDLFVDLVLALDESFKKIRRITKKFESFQFGFKCSSKKKTREIFVCSISFWDSRTRGSIIFHLKSSSSLKKLLNFWFVGIGVGSCGKFRSNLKFKIPWKINESALISIFKCCFNKTFLA
jgi:hypothetical protein